GLLAGVVHVLVEVGCLRAEVVLRLLPVPPERHLHAVPVRIVVLGPPARVVPVALHAVLLQSGRIHRDAARRALPCSLLTAGAPASRNDAARDIPIHLRRARLHTGAPRAVSSRGRYVSGTSTRDPWRGAYAIRTR